MLVVLLSVDCHHSVAFYILYTAAVLPTHMSRPEQCTPNGTTSNLSVCSPPTKVTSSKWPSTCVICDSTCM